MCRLQDSVKDPNRKVQKKSLMNVADEDIESILYRLMSVHDDLEDIMPTPGQVWNCDKIRIDPNGKWPRVMCTYKWCGIERVWKTQEGSCTILVHNVIFTRDVVHKYSE